MIKKYKGMLGEFEYDTEEYTILKYSEVLHYIGDGKDIRLPRGCISCNRMFESTKLRKLDLSNFDTTGVLDMSRMFYLAENLEELDLSNFNTESVTRMEYMFGHCNSLKVLELSQFNTERLQDCSLMIKHCENLRCINLGTIGSNIPLSYDFFAGCNRLCYIQTEKASWKVDGYTAIGYISDTKCGVLRNDTEI